MHPATRSQLRIALLVPAILLILTAVLNAQNSNSALRGLVQDASAARVAGAQVVVRLTGTGSSIAREVKTNERGEFRIEGLLPGPYHVTVTAKGFAEAAADVDTAVSVVRDITITLKPAAGHEAVNVKG